MKNARICLILNPTSGESNKFFVIRPLEDIVGFFQKLNFPITIKTTTCIGDATRLAKESIKQGYTHIIACGGDGTINEIVNGLAGEEVVMGIIPMGTENVLAKATGVPLDILGACTHFMNAEERSLDLGVANGRHFLIVSGIGLDARLISEMNPQMKSAFGSLAFLLNGAAALFLENEESRSVAKIRLLDKSEEYEFPFWLILAGNMSYYSGTVQLALDAKPDDGLLDIIVLPLTDSTDLPKQVFEVFAGTHLDNGDIPNFQSSRFEIVTDPPVYYQLDGEVVGKTPVLYEVKPLALKVRF